LKKRAFKFTLKGKKIKILKNMNFCKIEFKKISNKGLDIKITEKKYKLKSGLDLNDKK
jgi:hypothetical protein